MSSKRTSKVREKLYIDSDDEVYDEPYDISHLTLYLRKDKSIPTRNTGNLYNYHPSSAGEFHIPRVSVRLNGLMVILDQTNFIDQPHNKRHENEEKVKGLRRTAATHNLKTVVFKDPKLSDIQKIMNKLRVYDFTGHRSFIFVVLTNAHEQAMLAASDVQSYDYKEKIVNPLCQYNRSIKKIPTLFLFEGYKCYKTKRYWGTYWGTFNGIQTKPNPDFPKLFVQYSLDNDLEASYAACGYPEFSLSATRMLWVERFCEMAGQRRITKKTTFQRIGAEVWKEYKRI